MRVAAVIAVTALVACRQNAPSPEPQRATPEPRVMKVPPARHALELPGDGAGIAWDAGSSTLYVTDETHNRIASWRRDTAFTALGALPTAERVGLGALVRLPDGRLVTPSFGFGAHGAVFVVGPDNTQTVPGLDPKRRRIGLAQAPDGALYVGYFVVAPGSKPSGGIARLDLATGETDLITRGLGKPVGLVATDTTLYVADQDQLAILAFELPDPGAPRVIAKVPAADHLTRLPNGDLITGGKKGGVYRITLDGRVTTIAEGYEHVRGTAYDAAGKRLFVVEHSASSSRHRLHLLPVE